MQKHFVLILVLTCSLAAFAQETEPDTTRRTTQGTALAKRDTNQTYGVRPLSYDSAITILRTQQNQINADLAVVKANLDTIKANTEPPSVLGEFITNKFLDYLYDLLFGGEDKPGLIPFILSIIGLVVGFIRFVVLLIRFDKIKGEKVQKIQRIMIAFLLFITSSLLFLLTNRNFESAETVKLDHLENTLASIHKDIQTTQMLLSTRSYGAENTAALATEMDQYRLALQEIKKSIEDAEERTATAIEDHSTSGFWIFFICVLLLAVIFILMKVKIRI